ncbi:TetR/AcrR family transcriptional regulator [Corynebacterium hesseae]
MSREDAQPQRRELILTAALNTIVREGVAGLSLRAVAAEAHVALGSIAYYFTDKDGLINAAFQDFTHRSVTEFREFYEGVSTLEEARAATVDMLSATARSRTDIILGSELYSLSLRRPRHRMILLEWTRACQKVLSTYFDEPTTLGLDALYEGAVLHHAMRVGETSTQRIALAVERLTPPESFILHTPRAS